MSGIYRTANTWQDSDMDFEGPLVDAFKHLGIEVQRAGMTPDHETDFVVVDPAGVGVRIQIKHRSLVTEDVARDLLAKAGSSDANLLVVGDRVTESARTLLTTSRGGYYDLRGRLALRAEGLLIDVETEPVMERAGRSRALSGRAGLEVATSMLMAPHHGVVVRKLARELKRSASTVSEVLTALRRDGLVEADRTVPDSRLFWQVAERWSTPRTYLAQPPRHRDESGTNRPLRLGLNDIMNSAGWALTDSAAAATYGAPVATRLGQALDFYVPDSTVLRRAVTLLGSASSAVQDGATVRIAPVRTVCEQRVEFDLNPEVWPLAHPLFVALDLAQDVGRGREILDAWTPDERWARVW